MAEQHRYAMGLMLTAILAAGVVALIVSTIMHLNKDTGSIRPSAGTPAGLNPATLVAISAAIF